MNESRTGWLECLIVEEEIEFTLHELCRVSGASENEIFDWIEQGAIEPKRVSEDDGPHFDGASLRRARKARHLARDLEINAAGIALALDLLDEIEALRAQYTRR
ncbi:chaperone modulator CbpM [Paraburkholderia phytofirmans]|jgi:chaperone modulatory protein CbpM|uniref:chaperone modulator CbpM n=1 Tax=Paraburkholderia sp. BL9I2N2 TaxID=1938809 RepID=UPI001047CD4B|nr:chaperone modulator CbpM [Paraburkholderia sp. BL9I2N2]TCK95281.1 chaperone modulatory protein CbpM [Paraburkholderia sp. BL9I2N2]